MIKLLYASGRDSNMFYNIRLEIPDPFFFLDVGDQKYVFLSHLELGAFEIQNQNPAIRAVRLESLYGELAAIPGGGPGVGKIALVILKRYDLLDQDIFVPHTFPVFLADYLREQGVRVIPHQNLYPERAVKTAEEIADLRESVRRTLLAFRRIEEVLEESKIHGDRLEWKGETLTSELLKREVERLLLEHNMVNPEEMIISSGTHAAMPHHRGQGAILPNQTIVCDIFPKHRTSGLFSDISRTYIKGKPSAQAQRMFETVLELQKNAIAEVGPGKRFEDIHARTVKGFLERGYHTEPEGFTHSLGHGLGLEVHEFPFVRGTEALKPGHVITIEPGLYYTNIGGVRIEDVVLVTDTGSENLSEYPNRWIIS